MDMDQRRRVQQEFAGDARVLVSTDAGGEGLNLQFCHVVVNYDLPWNPMKLEQRIGRVDRIGQLHVVRAVNVTMEETVEHRIREVLEDKLRRILAEFGADKLGDVLDSEAAGLDFEDLYATAMADPGSALRVVDTFASILQDRIRAAREGLRLLGDPAIVEPGRIRELIEHQLPRWTERMTVSYLRTRSDAGAFARADGPRYRLRWEDGTEMPAVTFAVEPTSTPDVVQLSLEDARVRALVGRLPVFAPGQPIVAFAVPGVSDKVSGIWSLWRIRLETGEDSVQRVLPVFVSDDARVLSPTARVVWDRLIEAETQSVRALPGTLSGETAHDLFERSRRAAEEQGSALYRELLTRYVDRLKRERRKMESAFAARARSIDRLGLASVKHHRRLQLDAEQKAWEARMAAREQAWPELRALLLLRVTAIR